jgi:hypothetical protein
MMARNTNVPFKGRIQKRKTHHLQIITFGLQRAAGPYRWANSGYGRTHRRSEHRSPFLPARKCKLAAFRSARMLKCRARLNMWLGKRV